MNIDGDSKRLALPSEAIDAYNCQLKAYGEKYENPEPDKLHILDILLTPKSRQLDGEVIRELGIAAIQPDGHQLVFVNPDLAKRFSLAILVPALEKNPSAEKKKVYGEVLDFFDAADISGGPGSVFPNERTRQEYDLPNFREYYEPWVRALRGGEIKDWEAYQREQNARWERDPQKLKALQATLYGHSEAHPEEVKPDLP